MEKISLRPLIKELVFRNEDEDNVHFDASYYQGANGQEKNLGSLMVLGHIKYQGDDLAYLISLISSMAKREYYSVPSVQEQDPKTSFERTLKKLNDVLDEFFQNNKFKLSIGLLAIAGDNIFISRLGKFRVALARKDEYIDILNNIELFRKGEESAQKFSNIISGKLQPKDKLFAYFPGRSIISREKQLNPIFIGQGQEEFSQKLADLADGSKAFTLCGFHVNMLTVKEIPLPTSKKIMPDVIMGKLAYPVAEVTSSDEVGLKNQEQETEKRAPDLQAETPRIIPAEVSVGKRGNVFAPLLTSLSGLNVFRKFSIGSRKKFAFAALVIIIPLISFAIIRGGQSRDGRAAFSKAREDLKTAKTRLDGGDSREARSLLLATLAGVADFRGNKFEGIKNEAGQILNSVDKTSDKAPVLIFDAAGQKRFSKLAVPSDALYVLTDDGGFLAVGQTSLKELPPVGAGSFLTLADDNFALMLATDGNFSFYHSKTQKLAKQKLTLPGEGSFQDADFYENNLYLLFQNSIHKYGDVTQSGLKPSLWISDNANGQLISLTVDGNVYALNDEGKVVRYFKNQKDGELDLKIKPSRAGVLRTGKDSPFLFLSDPENRRVYVFDKNGGALKTSYDLSHAGQIIDLAIDAEKGLVWALSADNKIWQIGQ